MKNKKKVLLLIVSILGVIGIVFGLSYAWFVLTVKGEKTNAIKAGELSLILNETGDALNITDAFPVTDEEGLKGAGTTFTLRNDGTKNVEYKIKLLYDEASCSSCKKMPSSAVKYSLMRNQVESERANLGANNNVLESGVINGKTSYSYELKIWLDENAGNEAQNAYFYGKLEIEAVQTNLVGPADESCFTFNAGTITGYSNSCTKDLVIPETINGEAVTAIGANAFNSKHLKTVEMPDGITTIGNNAFYGNQLTSVTLPEQLKTIGGFSFQKNQLTSVNFSNHITNIGVQAFADNQITHIEFPNSVVRIDRLAFSSNQLTSITIPSSVTFIGGGAFSNNQLPDADAFIYARNSDGTENREKLVSYGGAKRDNVVIPNLKIIENESFMDTQITSVSIPSSVNQIGNAAFNNCQLSDAQAFIYQRNSDGTENKTILVSYGGAKRDNVVIPSSVVTVNSQAFQGNKITSVTIPSSVGSIGSYAFNSNQLTSIVIPSSVLKIETAAFINNRLTSVVIQGKTNSAGFTGGYPSSSPFGWAKGYSDANIIWNG